MATWQYHIELVPKNLHIAPGDYTRFHEESLWWVKNQLPTDFERTVSTIFPRGESWSDELIVWGDLEKTCVEAWTDNDRISSITIRLDLRELTESMLEKITSLIATLQADIYDIEANKLLNPEIDQLLQAISDSRAARFVSNPREFLAQLSKGRNLTGR